MQDGDAELAIRINVWMNEGPCELKFYGGDSLIMSAERVLLIYQEEHMDNFWGISFSP